MAVGFGSTYRGDNMNCSYCGREVANLCVGRLGLLCVACHRDEMEQEDLLARRIAQPGEPDPSDTFGGPHVTVPLASTSLLAWPRPPEAPQAPLSDPARETANPSPPSEKNTAETDTDVWISFKLAQDSSNLTAPEISKLCKAGKIRYQGERRGRKVHSSDLAKCVADRVNRES